MATIRYMTKRFEKHGLKLVLDISCGKYIVKNSRFHKSFSSVTSAYNYYFNPKTGWL